MKIAFLVVFTIMLSLLSCNTQKQVTAPLQTVEVASINIEESGEKMFQKRCAECHDLYAPNAFTSQQWEPIVFDMQKKGGISNDDTYLILDYLKKNAKP
jgi:cytochrome c5